MTQKIKSPGGHFTLTPAEIREDYRMAYRSRQASLLGRKEVLSGRGSFGIFGDGKELPQIALSRVFQKGDFRSGYYRDQTFMFASEMATVPQFFAQLYANADKSLEPHSGGRGMVCHFGSRLLDDSGNWKDLLAQKNSSSDISPTAGQMSRLLGLAYASKLYRHVPSMKDNSKGFSLNGNEVAFGSIGDASTSEGIFWETINAAGVLQVPMVMSVWDDGYGISVPREFQTTKGSISEALAGFHSDTPNAALKIHKVKAWDYLALLDTYAAATAEARKNHQPCLIHVEEVTQPQGHSTSGSHERYKSKERLEWELDRDCVRRMRDWMLEKKIITEAELESLEASEREHVTQAKNESWAAYLDPIKAERDAVLSLLEPLQSTSEAHEVQKAIQELKNHVSIKRGVVQGTVMKLLFALRGVDTPAKAALQQWLQSYRSENLERYNSHLHSQSQHSPLNERGTPAQYGDAAEVVDGRVVLQKNFEALFDKNPLVFTLGEDVGKLGDVNLVYEGLQARFGELRVSDTGIREATILGQAIGAALRGLRPIADIQYLDYLLYALQIMSDDLATLHFRTAGGQKAPVIVRTKGHRLEGIWHTGSPLGMILHSLRGIHVCVPRNCTQAAGLYNTLIEGDDPALVIEVLNGYRLKEKLPANIGAYKIPLGVPEVVRPGQDVTVVTYGACVRLALEAAQELEKLGVSIEVIDVQTLLPFDTSGVIVASLAKTNAVLFLDEDVPGGATGFMMQQVLEAQKGFDLLDASPRTLTAKDNRSGYGKDADFYCKPGPEDVMEAIWSICRERAPGRFPTLW